MREILFRSWSEIDECFYYFINGFYYLDLDIWHNEVDQHCFKWGKAEQFTGLLYKNGVKIFEGDKTSLGIVKYYCGGFIVENIEKGIYQTLLDLSEFDDTHCDLEVIGNIYD